MEISIKSDKDIKHQIPVEMEINDLISTSLQSISLDAEKAKHISTSEPTIISTSTEWKENPSYESLEEERSHEGYSVVPLEEERNWDMEELDAWEEEERARRIREGVNPLLMGKWDAINGEILASNYSLRSFTAKAYQVASDLKETTYEASESMMDSASAVAQSVKDSASWTTEGILDSASAVASSVRDSAHYASESISNMSYKAADIAKENVPVVTEALKESAFTLKDITFAASDYIQETAPIVVDNATSVAESVKETIVENAPAVAETMKDTAVSVANTLGYSANVAASYVAEKAPIVAESMKDTAVSAATVTKDYIKETTPIVVDYVAEKAPIVAESMKDTAESMKDSAVSAAYVTKEYIKETAPVVAESIMDSAYVTKEYIKEVTPVVVEKTASAAESLKSTGYSALLAAAHATGAVIGKAQQMEEALATKVFNKIVDLEGSVVDKVSGMLGYTGTAPVYVVEKETTVYVEKDMSSWTEVERAEEMERARRLNAKVDPLLDGKKHRVERELLQNVTKC